jgi:PAS domain S-box-containing protein
MQISKPDFDEQQRRALQEYVFDLEDIKEEAEELSIAHEKLQRSQDLLLTVLTCTVHGLCLIQAGKFLWCNQAFKDIFGWDHQELTGRALEALCHCPADYAKVSENLDAALQQSGLFAQEYEFLHKDGRRVPCFVTCRSLDNDDISKGYVLSITDVTERTRAQAALQAAYHELEQRTTQLLDTNRQLNREIDERKLVEERLNKYREHLEELVEARTAQLTQVNYQLRQEIVERRRAEESLQKTNDYLESILKNSPDAITIVDRHGKFVKWSQMAADLFGGDYSSLSGLSAFECYVNPIERDRMLDLLRKEGFVNKYEIEVKREDGTSFPVEMSISLLKDNENITIGSIAIGRDLSNMKKMLEALRETNEQLSKEIAAHQETELSLRKSENEYRAIFENTGTATVILEADTTISLANAEYEKLSGFSRKDVEGKRKWTEFVVADDLERMKAHHHLRRVDEKAAPRQYEFRFTDNFGGIKHVFLTVAMIPGTTRSVAALLDITEKKAMEAEILKAQKLESIGLLAGGIAHDFNNILTSIVGSISLAKTYAKPGDRIYERMEETEKAAARAKDLTQQLLTFSRGGAPVKRSVNIAELVKDSATFALRGSNVQLQTAFPEILWPVEIDEGQISQVVNNLIINADQAMPSGGTVSVDAENVMVAPSTSLSIDPGRYVRISIRDGGAGIPKEQIGKVFDPYFTTKQTGCGLGLATVYSIVKRHGGQITVESEPGKGTTFSFCLPAAANEAAQALQPEREPVAGSGRILVMEDELIVQEVLGEMISYLGYEVTFAGDGAEAIELYKASKSTNRPFDLVIMDLTIPGGMGGKEAIARLLEIDPEVKAIVSSGYFNDPVMANSQQYGFVGVLSKPYRVDQLSKILEKVNPIIRNQ